MLVPTLESGRVTLVHSGAVQWALVKDRLSVVGQSPRTGRVTKILEPVFCLSTLYATCFFVTTRLSFAHVTVPIPKLCRSRTAKSWLPADSGAMRSVSGRF